MRQHPKKTKSRKPRKSLTTPCAKRKTKPRLPQTQPASQPKTDGPGGFLSLLLERIGWAELNGLNQRRHGAGRPAKRLTRGQLLAGILFHYTISFAGTLGEHVFWLFGIQLAESTLSERRQTLPFEVFQELLARVLRPLKEAPAQAFYLGLRLTAIDGVCFSLSNTFQIKQTCRKGGNGRGQAAFAKLQCAALLELALHNPLAACLARQGESEWKLALGLLDQLPARCLLLADRLYGCGAFVVAAWEKLRVLHGHFLVRVKENLKVVRVIKRFKDGSRLVEIKALEKGDTHEIAATLQVREIRATLQRPGFRSVKLRLWTSLLNPGQAPAAQLVELYTTRWEEELYFRELKKEMDVNDLLRSQTLDTAAQEVTAMIIGSSLVAGERAKLRPGEELCHRISFRKTWELLEPLWLTLLLGADILSEEQKQALCERFYDLAARRVMPKKRHRSCPRVLRRPLQSWPRKRNQKEANGPLTVSIARARS